jgi:hypothetical protein
MFAGTIPAAILPRAAYSCNYVQSRDNSNPRLICVFSCHFHCLPTHGTLTSCCGSAPVGQIRLRRLSARWFTYYLHGKCFCYCDAVNYVVVSAYSQGLIPFFPICIIIVGGTPGTESFEPHCLSRLWPAFGIARDARRPEPKVPASRDELGALVVCGRALSTGGYRTEIDFSFP